MIDLIMWSFVCLVFRICVSYEPSITVWMNASWEKGLEWIRCFCQSNPIPLPFLLAIGGQTSIWVGKRRGKCGGEVARVRRV